MTTKALSARVMALIERAEPLERLRVLRDVAEQAPAIRSAAFAELIEAGWSRYAIAQELGISHQAVYQTAGRPKKRRN